MFPDLFFLFDPSAADAWFGHRVGGRHARRRHPLPNAGRVDPVRVVSLAFDEMEAGRIDALLLRSEKSRAFSRQYLGERLWRVHGQYRLCPVRFVIHGVSGHQIGNRHVEYPSRFLTDLKSIGTRWNCS